MRKNILFLFCFLQLSLNVLQAQTQTPTKHYPSGARAGYGTLLYEFGQYNTDKTLSRIYVVDISRADKYYLTFLCNAQRGDKLLVQVDGAYNQVYYPGRDGWQTGAITTESVYMTSGKHTISFTSSASSQVPMVEEISLGTTVPAVGRGSDPNAAFLEKVNSLQQQPLARTPTVAEAGDLTSKVLPNPEGKYDHALDTNFTYSHFSTIYLGVGYHTFTTTGSTVSRSLTIFNTSNYNQSWSNVNGGAGGESYLNIYVSQASLFYIMLRPYPSGTGVTNIIYNGTTLVSNAVVGGRSYAMSELKGGPLNFFTTRLTGGDTRMIASRYLASSARGYNDDYATSGDWTWGLASRIKKDFGTDSVAYGFVCAYSPNSTGNSDVYLGNLNSTVNNVNQSVFPLLKPDDAILASNTGYYNCISWSGGVTATWIWPPNLYSTYNCSNSDMDIACFDHFYANQPVRYPGAWNYTRNGATVNSAVVDLWALNGHFTHGSVRKPGNNHPHGYDWESKPGGLDRTFHPRNALTNLNFGYGAVVNYYIPTGTYARNAAQAFSFESDVHAVKAGVAVFEHARLTETSSGKLNNMLRKADPSFAAEFNRLYEMWKQTWAANAMYSDPAMYCKNAQHEALAAFAARNPRQAMLLVFDKFVNENDHFIGQLMWTLTGAKYGKLLDEVKTERARNPNDEAGRYKIHGDHDNGVLYVEKILKQLEEEPVVTTVTETVNVVVSPNPVKDRMSVQLNLTKSARVSVQVISGQTRQTRTLQTETTLPAGNHRFNLDIAGFAGNTGDIIAVQVMVDGQLKTVKVLVNR